MINIDAPLPEHIYASLPGAETVRMQPVDVDQDRWGKALSKRGLPGFTGALAGHGKAIVRRADVFALAEGEPSPEAAMQLLYTSLAWGLGLRAPWLHARLKGIAHDQRTAEELLVGAWYAVRDGQDTEKSYSILTTDRGQGRIRFLGPAFASKFLYFAQGAETPPAHLILDRVVARKLREPAWPDAPTSGWWPGTYANYCKLMQRWAAEAEQRAGREVRADEIEYTVFKS